MVYWFVSLLIYLSSEMGYQFVCLFVLRTSVSWTTASFQAMLDWGGQVSVAHLAVVLLTLDLTDTCL